MSVFIDWLTDARSLIPIWLPARRDFACNASVGLLGRRHHDAMLSIELGLYSIVGWWLRSPLHKILYINLVSLREFSIPLNDLPHVPHGYRKIRSVS
jgi:hypothetical protein